MLCPDYVFGKTDNAQVTLSKVVDHVDHICQLAGNAQHVAIGSDLDGGYGREQSPSDLDTIADLQKMIPILESRKYPSSDIENVMYGNWLRFFQDAWRPAAKTD
jgi:membrane dipeptidase